MSFRISCLFFFLLLFSFVFANSFPQSIEGTPLELVYYEGDSSNGIAYYESSDKGITVKVTVIQMSASEWEETIQSVDYYGINKLTEEGVDYYYSCESAQYYEGDSGESFCSVVFYYNGKGYGVDAYKNSATDSSEVLEIAVITGTQVAGIGENNSFCFPAVLGLMSLFYYSYSKENS